MRSRNVPEWRPRTFDPLEHSFNPLADLDYRKAYDVLDVFDALFMRDETTLTMGLAADGMSVRDRAREDKNTVYRVPKQPASRQLTLV